MNAAMTPQGGATRKTSDPMLSSAAIAHARQRARLLRACTLAAALLCSQAYGQTPPADTPAPVTDAAAAAPTPPAAAAAAAEPKTATEQLPGVQVKGKRDVLGDADARLRKLKESLPELGDGGTVRDSLGERVREKVVDTVKKDDVNKRSPEGKQFMNRVMNPLDAHAGDAAATQTKEDFKDTYCGTDECPH